MCEIGYGKIRVLVAQLSMPISVTGVKYRRSGLSHFNDNVNYRWSVPVNPSLALFLSQLLADITNYTNFPNYF